MASIEERTQRDGTPRWRVVWRQDGTKQSVTCETADDAVRWRKLVEGSGNRWPAGQDPRPAVRTVLTFADWAAQAVERRTRASDGTKATYRRDVERHLNPLLGSVPLDAVTDREVAAWIAAVRDPNYTPPGAKKPSPLSTKTLKNLHGLASSIFADALAQHPPLVTHNPFARRLAVGPSVRTEEMVFLNGPEIGTLLGAIREEYRDLARLLFGTGVRFGEATALTVGDVDLLERQTLTVTKAWKRVGTAEYVVGEPKTPRSRRTIGLSSELVDMLAGHVAGRGSSELLFPDRHGNRLPHIEFYKRGWAPAVAAVNVCPTCRAPQKDGRGRQKLLPAPCSHPGVLGKRPRIHDARHSHASLLIAAGLPLPAISRRLGHSSISITVDRYGHLDPALDQQINAAVDLALTSGRERVSSGA